MNIEITGMAPDGVGFGEVDGARVYVRDTVPGDRVEAGRPRRERGRQWARLIRRTNRDRTTVEPVCRHFGTCGGCDWMDLPYADQLALKRASVGEAFDAEGMTVDVAEVAPSPDPLRYRNRVTFAFANGEGGPVLGLYERSAPTDRTHALPPVCPVDDCWLASEKMNAVRRAVQASLDSSRLRAYNPVTRSGVLRWLDVRTGDDGMAVQLAVANDKHVPVDALADAVREAGATAFTIRVGRERSRHAAPRREVAVFGAGVQTARILGCEIAFSGGVFSQVNAGQMETLYRLAAEMCACGGAETVLDLYCGVGTLSVPLARRSARVTGVESDARAVEDANANALRNGLENCTFVCADAADVSAWGDARQYDVVTVNPPRAGLSPGVIEGVASTRAPTVVYVSCNPETLARDCRRLCANGYGIAEVRPVDMFPQTVHVETVVRLTRA